MDRSSKPSDRIARALGVIVAAFMVMQSGLAGAQLANSDLPQREGIKLKNLGLKAGNVKVHAAFKVEEQFDSNVYLADSGVRWDLITMLSPSFGVEIPLGDHSFSADYAVDIYRYAQYVTEDHVDQTLRGVLVLNLTDYKITISDTYRQFTNRSSSEDSVRLTQKTNRFKAGVSAQFELLGFDVGYMNKIDHYPSTDLDWGPISYYDRSYTTHIIQGQVNYRLFPKTKILLESDLGFNRYYISSYDPDSWYTQTVIGFKGAWFKKAQVDYKVGFRYQDYGKSDLVANKGFIGLVMSGGFDYFMTVDDIVSVDAERTIYESTYQNMNYYNANIIGLRYTHLFSDKLSADAYGSYQLNLYPSEVTENGTTAKRYDNFYVFGCSVRYNIRKWLAVQARYERTQKMSIFSPLDYKDNMITVSGTIGF